MTERKPEGKMVAFDGLSLAGKSTMVAMTEETTGATVVRENTFDPHRPATSQLNKLLKEISPNAAAKQIAEDFPQSAKAVKNALEYGMQFKDPSQPMLARMFTEGRRVVNQHVLEIISEQDVILDRWQVTGWAYQVDPDHGYKWQDIMRLNEEFDIALPDVQIILTCPIDQINQRRAYRQKQTVGTAGQMSGGREHVILSTLKEIHGFLETRIKTFWVENKGTPTQNIRDQILQAIPTFQDIKRVLEGSGFQFESESVTDLHHYWTTSSRLDRIYNRQTS